MKNLLRLSLMSINDSLQWRLYQLWGTRVRGPVNSASLHFMDLPNYNVCATSGHHNAER